MQFRVYRMAAINLHRMDLDTEKYVILLPNADANNNNNIIIIFMHHSFVDDDRPE